MSYKGYAARIEFSADDACFVGHIAGIQDVVGFHGDSVDKLKAAFTDAVEDYLKTCQRMGKQPQLRQSHSTSGPGASCCRGDNGQT